MLKLQGIKQQLDENGIRLMKFSLEDKTLLEDLIETYRNLLQLRNQFLEVSFNNSNVGQLEDLRFSPIENTLSIKILIQNQVGQHASETIEKLKQIYEEMEEISV